MSCSMQWAHVGFLFELRFIEHYQSKIIIRMVDQEVLFDDIEQEIIKPPRNSSKKTLKRYTRYPCHWYFVQKLWGCIPTVASEIAKLLHLFTHHCQQHPTSAPTKTLNNVRSCCIHLQVTKWVHTFFEKINFEFWKCHGSEIILYNYYCAKFWEVADCATHFEYSVWFLG